MTDGNNFLKKFNNNNILRAIVTIASFSVIAKFLSFFIELIIAYCFGATSETDVFYLVYGIVQTITPMITVGIWKVFMPAYKESVVLKQYKEANILTDELLFIFSMFGFFLMLLICFFPAFFTNIFAPGFEGEKLLLTIKLLNVVSPIFLIIIVSVFYSAILQSDNKFSKSQQKYVIQHVPTLLYLLFFFRTANIVGLTISLLIGEICACIITAHYVNLQYTFSFPNYRISEKTIKTLRLVPAACLNSVINQIAHVVDKAFGSLLQTGALTYLNYGGKLISLFDGIVSTAFSTAVFPRMAEYIALKDTKGFSEFIINYLLLLLAILMPTTTIIILYYKEIVSVAFGYGNFGMDSVNKTALVFLMYGIGLIGMGLNTILNDILYVYKRVNQLVATNIFNILSNVILDYYLIRIYEVSGLSLATTISLYISLLMKVFFARKIFKLNIMFFENFLDILLACIIGFLLTLLIKRNFSLPDFLTLLLGTFIFITTYALTLFRKGTIFRTALNEFVGKRSSL